MTTRQNSRVIIFDTTLRDGEQSPGCSMTTPRSCASPRCWRHMGVDVIEAGFPIASDGDFQAVQRGRQARQGSRWSAAWRAPAYGDIDRAAEALQPAERKRIHTFIGTSPLHRKYQLQLDAEQVHERVIDSVTRARRYTDDVEWSGDGRLAHRARLPVPLHRERDHRPAPPRSTSRTRWATPIPRSSRT